MDFFSQTAARFIQDNGLATILVIFIGWFMVSKVWPFYTTVYLPQHLAQQEHRDKITAELRDAILELKLLTVQLVTTVQQQDANTRELILALGSNQQTVLDLLAEQRAQQAQE